MRVTIYLTEDQAELLDTLADMEHRTVRQQATVLVIQGLERDARLNQDKLQTAAA